MKLVFGFESLSDSWLESVWKTNLSCSDPFTFIEATKPKNVALSVTCASRGHVRHMSHFENFTSNKRQGFTVRLSKKLGNQHLLPFMLNARNPSGSAQTLKHAIKVCSLLIIPHINVLRLLFI